MIVKKIMLLGEIAVGKTSIARRLEFQMFDENYKATIGSDLYHYKVEPSPAPEPFQFIVWDTDGSYGETIFRHVYMKEAHAAMIVGDITRPQTIDAMLRLGEMFYDIMPGRYCGFILNKIDLAEAGREPDVTARIRKLAGELARTSAKSGEGIAEAFARAARSIVRRGL